MYAEIVPLLVEVGKNGGQPVDIGQTCQLQRFRHILLVRHAQ